MKRLLLVGLVACGPHYDHTTIDGLNGFPTNTVTVQRIYVVEGTVIKAHIESVNTDGDTMTSDIASADPTVLTIVPTVTDHDYTFQGSKAGRTEVTVKADGKLVIRIEAIVEEQSPL